MGSCRHQAQWAENSIHLISEFCRLWREEERRGKWGVDDRLGGERRGEEKRNGAVGKVASPLQKVTGKVAAVLQWVQSPRALLSPLLCLPLNLSSLNRLEGVIQGL